MWNGEESVGSPLRGWSRDTDHHNGGVGEDLLERFIVLAFLQIVSQFLRDYEQSREQLIPLELNCYLVLKQKVNNTWSHLDCPDVVKRVWDQRFKLWKSFGVFVSCKFMNNIWKQTVAIRIIFFNAGGRNVSENALKTHWAHCRSLLWDYWLLRWVCIPGQPQLDHRLRENKNCLVKLDNPWPLWNKCRINRGIWMSHSPSEFLRCFPI